MMYFLIFFILFICANPEIQNLFANMIGKQSSDSVSGFLLALFGCLLVVLVHNTMKSSSAEPFLFQVSKFNPRCNGLYRGKPSTYLCVLPLPTCPNSKVTFACTVEALTRRSVPP